MRKQGRRFHEALGYYRSRLLPEAQKRYDEGQSFFSALDFIEWSESDIRPYCPHNSRDKDNWQLLPEEELCPCDRCKRVRKRELGQ
jgi:hypothetical protein